jgi:hypothetical protein
MVLEDPIRGTPIPAEVIAHMVHDDARFAASLRLFAKVLRSSEIFLAELEAERRRNGKVMGEVPVAAKEAETMVENLHVISTYLDLCAGVLTRRAAAKAMPEADADKATL